MCTGISLVGADGTAVYGRTMEWGAFDLHSRALTVPRGIDLAGSTPDGAETGKAWTSSFGFVGLDALDHPAIVDGINERGLACGAFYHPGFAEYQPYEASESERSISSLELTHYLLSICGSVPEIPSAIKDVRVVPVAMAELGFPPPLHYIAVDAEGRSLVIEYLTGGEPKIFENPLGVITNAPEFDWHLTNLRNYVNLSPVEVPAISLAEIDLAPVGAGSGMLGLPGDNTPPSRFVRAVAFTQTARPTTGGFDTVSEVLRILDNFNLPAGAAEGADLSGDGDAVLPASTLWTTAADTKNLVFYYHTAWNRRLRKIDLNEIDFGVGEVTVSALDDPKEEDVEDVTPMR